MPRLADFSSPDRLKELVDKLTDGGKRNHRFENMSIQNISTWKSAGIAPPVDSIDIYGYPAENPLYIFLIERSGLNLKILSECLKEMMTVALPFIHKKGELLLDSDTLVREEFFKLIELGEFPLEIRSFGDLIPFYIDEKQKQELIEMKLTAPEGFVIDKFYIEKEYEMIHSKLAYADEVAAELTKQRLTHFPSVCIRDCEGNLASWEMAQHYGQLTHLYTVPTHRGKGIGLLAELLQAQQFAKTGLQVFKYVDADNEKVIRATKKHPLWKRWVSTREDNERRDGEDEIMWACSILSLVDSK